MRPATPDETKRCAFCGRTFAWRKKWARDWASVRYCADACRRGALPVDRTLDDLVLSLLARRAEGATICPSEVARAHEPGEWRRLMPRVHEAVARLEAQDRVRVTQGGAPTRMGETRGAYRVRLQEHGTSPDSSEGAPAAARRQTSGVRGSGS